jgi:hypothetical protein
MKSATSSPLTGAIAAVAAPNMSSITVFIDTVGWLLGCKDGTDEAGEPDEGVLDGSQLGTDDKGTLDGRHVASPSVGIDVGNDNG